MLPAIVQGLSVLLDPAIIALMIGGIIIGLVFGILPGLSGLVGIAILIPLIYGMEPVHALVLLMAMHVVTYQGGSVTAIMLNIPGTGPNAATLFDGFPMTQQGHSGRALGNALTASVLGGLFGAIVLALVIPVIRPIVLAFQSPECLILILIGISFIALLGGGSASKGLIAGGLGLILSFIGYQGLTGVVRYNFGSIYLYDGIKLVPLALGLFAIPTTIDLITTGGTIAKVRTVVASTRADLFQGIKDVFHHWQLLLRCSGIGTLVGTIPGIGGDVAVFVAYGHGKQTSKHPERFGTGCEEGVIAPESANNAKEGGSLIPTLAFGIPGSAAMAVLLGAFLIIGLQPGPMFLKEHLDIAFTLVGVIVLANILGSGIVMLASGKLAKIAFVRGHILGPLILILVALGAYSVRLNMLDVLTAFILGGLGYAMTRLGYSRPALFLGYVLGELGETYFYISLAAYGWLFLTKPIVLILITVAVLGLSYKRIGALFRKRAGTS